MKVLTVSAVSQLIRRHGLHDFLHTVIDDLEREFCRWQEISKVSRLSTYVENGVLELMPCSDGDYYSFKYVNGHPLNTSEGKLCVVAFGMLANIHTGYPILLSEMTLLTAIRTAATAALAAKYLARANSHKLAIIGTGAQSEFQVLGMAAQFALTDIYYFDIDANAMKKFSKNLSGECFELHPCSSIEEAVSHGDILITATADKNKNQLITPDMLRPGMHIHAMGGDCPGKTEYDSNILLTAKVVVEYLPQSLGEGEIQNANDEVVYAELWELIAGSKQGRVNADEITFFDSVGFALEDFSILKTVNKLVADSDVGEMIDLIPVLSNPKDLFSLIR